MKTLLKTICESAFHSRENGNLNVIGIFETISSIKYPATHSKMVFVWILEGKPGEDVNYHFNIQDSTGKTVVDKSNESAKAKLGPNGKIHLVYNVLNVNLSVEGKYTVNLFVNDFKDSLDFEAKLISGTVV